jgi:CRP-like cAMP-binding protein
MPAYCPARLQVPLLKGLSDNDLLHVAGRMPERMYGDGEALITYGERGDEMYLIRHGKVGCTSCCSVLSGRSAMLTSTRFSLHSALLGLCAQPASVT